MKKSLLLSAIFMLLATTTASADVVKNKDTGFGSFNIAKIKKTTTVKATTVQAALVVNKVDVTQNTGGNNIIGNTKVIGAGGTGDARTTITINNDVNNAYTEVNGCGCIDGDNKAINDQTGPGSINVAKIEENSTTQATTVQLAAVVNVVSTEQNTGENNVIGNTKVVGTDSSGDTATTVKVVNDVNESITLFNATP